MRVLRRSRIRSAVGGCMVDKKIIVQYASLVREYEEVSSDIRRIEKNIDKLEKRLKEIEDGEIVKDRVYGGEGGIQGFNIEGIPTAEYDRDAKALLHSKLILEARQARLKLLQFEIKSSIDSVNEFIATVDDSLIRRIISYRIVKQMTWERVANAIGGGNTAGGVRMAFERYLQKK